MSEEIARRDFFVESTVRAAREGGYEVDAEAVARQAARDLSMVDRARALGDIDDGKTKRKPVEQAERPAVSHASAFAGRMGATTWEAPLVAENMKPLPKLYGTDALKLLAMDARIRLLMAPVPGYKLKVTRDPTTGEVTDCEPLGNQCQYPAFANRLFMEMACYSRALGTYAGMSIDDRQRKYVRAVEEVCNRSLLTTLVPRMREKFPSSATVAFVKLLSMTCIWPFKTVSSVNSFKNAASL